jgi:FSR family fosmidomycin resistance protein-like MFS transporter
MMPRNIGFASGLVLGLAVGGGGIGVAVTGAIADMYSISWGLLLLGLPIIAAIIGFVALPYPWKRWRNRGVLEA